MSAGIDVLADQLRPARGEPDYRESRMSPRVDPVFLHVLHNWLADSLRAVERRR
jgi:hypothetical protein